MSKNIAQCIPVEIATDLTVPIGSISYVMRASDGTTLILLNENGKDEEHESDFTYEQVVKNWRSAIISILKP